MSVTAVELNFKLKLFTILAQYRRTGGRRPFFLSNIPMAQSARPHTVLFKMVRPSRVTEQVDVDEIGQLSLVTQLVDE